MKMFFYMARNLDDGTRKGDNHLPREETLVYGVKLPGRQTET